MIEIDHDLIDAYLDGTLTPEQGEALQVLLRADSDARATLRRRAAIDEHLTDLALGNIAAAPVESPQAVSGSEIGNPLVGTLSVHQWKTAFRLLFGSLALLAMGVWMGFRMVLPLESTGSEGMSKVGDVVAELTQTVGCRWQGSLLPTLSGSKLESGTLRLTAGLATIVFRSGAEIVLEGPAEIELISPMRCFLRKGKLVAKVPPEAKEFTVVTEHADLIDQGTEFGVSVSSSGALGMSVFDGLVEVRHRRSGVLKEFQAGETSVIGADGAMIDVADQFEGWGPDPAPNSWSDEGQIITVSTAFGQGRDGYIQSGNPATINPEVLNHNSETLLLLKNGISEGHTRKAYLGFDLSPLKGFQVVDAVLNLTTESSGFGYATPATDAVFAVYGLTEETLDEWSVSGLGWNTAPANLPGGAEVDLSRAVMIGEFTLLQGDVSASCEVRGRRLIEFLNQDTNNLATFIIVRVTEETAIWSVVHAFAGKNHLTSAAPTLRMKIGPMDTRIGE